MAENRWRVIVELATLSRPATAVKHNSDSEARTGLLEAEEPTRPVRSKIRTEIPQIPQPIAEESADRQAEKTFLRSQKRVAVRRRGGLRFLSHFGWKASWTRLAAAVLVVAALGCIAALGLAIRSWFVRSPYFMLRSTASIQIHGNRVVTKSDALTFFAPDVGHSIFQVPLATRQAQLQHIDWVRLATVMRLWPDHLLVHIVERTPIAFARDGHTIRLVDDQGVLLDLPDAVSQHYSFPVLDGISAADPRSMRAARIEMYRQFVAALDAQGGHISSTLSEVDLSDPEDIRAVFLGGTDQPLVHFGDSDFLSRYQAYQAHLALWLQHYPQLRSVDMRYGKQVVLDTGTEPESNTPQNASHMTGAAPLSPDQASAIAAAIPVAKTASSTSKAKFVRHSLAARHRATTHARHRRESRHAPKRGYSVRHPLMHVVKGM